MASYQEWLQTIYLFCLLLNSVDALNAIPQNLQQQMHDAKLRLGFASNFKFLRNDNTRQDEIGKTNKNHTSHMKDNGLPQDKWDQLQNANPANVQEETFKNKAVLNNLQEDATFFFTHTGPHSFEYRGMFKHDKNQVQPPGFQPFMHEFPDMTKDTFPAFPPFPNFPELFNKKDTHDKFPLFHFHTTNQNDEVNLRSYQQEPTPKSRPISTEILDGPFKRYDVVLGRTNTKYPKIFHFNEERMNIADFEKQKKAKKKLGGLGPNRVKEPENVQRNQLLILHGGIFTVQEPPAYNLNAIAEKELFESHNIYKKY